MKKLLIVRHAKASWNNTLFKDYERPLTKNGHQDALLIAQYLKTKHHIPDYIISSSAKRAIQTTNIISQILSPELSICKERLIYGGSTNEMISIIHTIDNQYNNIMMVGHNPTTTLLINKISNSHIDYVPTSGSVIIEFTISKWQHINNNGTLIDFIHPKKLKIL